MIFYYYHIINTKNEKEYIGITEKIPEERFNQHKKMLRKNNHPNYKLQFDWNCYGEENFSFEIIEKKEYSDIEIGYAHEYELIQASTKELYNIAPGGLVNVMYNPDVKAKMKQTKQSQVPNVYCLEEVKENHFKIVGVFPSQKEAARAKPNWHQGTIQQAIVKHTKGHGYYWVNEQDVENNLLNWRPTRIKIKPTALVDTCGNIIEVHHNARNFEKENNYRAGAVSASICHGTYCHGKRYIYISEEEYYKLKPITLVK